MTGIVAFHDMHSNRLSQRTVWWTAAGAIIGLACLVLVYATHPGGWWHAHQRFAAAYVVDTLPFLLAWMGWLTARLQGAQAQLRNTLNTLSPWSDGAGIDALLDAALLVGPDGLVVAANPAALAHFGSRSLAGTPVQRLLPALSDAELRRRERRTRGPKGPLVGFEWDMRARRADDTHMPVTVHCGPASANRVVYIVRPAVEVEETVMADPPADSPATIIPHDLTMASTPPPKRVVVVDAQPPDAREALRRKLARVGLPDLTWQERPTPSALVAEAPRALLVDASAQEIGTWLSQVLRDPALAGMPVLVAAADNPPGVPDDAHIGLPIDAHEVVSRLRHLERTVGGCVVVGSSERAQHVHQVLTQAGWAVEVQPTLPAADTSIRARRRALVVVVDAKEQPPRELHALLSVRGLVLSETKPQWGLQLWPEHTFPPEDADLVSAATRALQGSAG
ncbi:MAG: hypothetical protein KTR31_23385 [Myxococcales bacterium]|nr:hypothetical protein [Myxococcales bacterium]